MNEVPLQGNIHCSDAPVKLKVGFMKKFDQSKLILQAINNVHHLKRA